MGLHVYQIHPICSPCWVIAWYTSRPLLEISLTLSLYQGCSNCCKLCRWTGRMSCSDIINVLDVLKMWIIFHRLSYLKGLMGPCCPFSSTHFNVGCQSGISIMKYTRHKMHRKLDSLHANVCPSPTYDGSCVGMDSDAGPWCHARQSAEASRWPSGMSRRGRYAY